MTSFMLILSVIYFLAKDITGAPLRNIEHDNEVFDFFSEKRSDDPELLDDR